MAEIIRALLVFRGLRPVEEIVLLALGFLREQVVGDADGELAFGGELFDDRIVFRVVLEAAAGVDRAGHAEPVQLAHEMPRRVDLIVERQFRAAGEGRVENAGIRLRQQQAGRVASAVANDLAGRRIRRVLGVTDRSQGSSIEQRTIVEVQQENRRIRSNRVQLLDGGQTLLGELMLGEATDHPHPLRRRCHRHLPLEHRHRIGERAHAVPAQFHVEVEPAANDVQVIVDQAGQHAPALEVDNLGLLAGELHHIIVAAHRGEFAVRDRDRSGGRIGAVECREQAAMEDKVGCRV